MTRHGFLGGLFCALLSLAACGPLQQENRARGIVQSLFQQTEEAAPAAAAALTRAAIEAQQMDLLRVSIISLRSTDLLGKVTTNGNVVTWQSSDGVTLAMDRGLLVGTRGTGFDLMGADVAAARASLAGGGSHTRRLDFMNGLDQIEQMSFQCQTVVAGRETITIVERAYATTRYEETCESTRVRFRNIYWVDAGGVIWQSRQWISEGIGYLGYQRL